MEGLVAICFGCPALFAFAILYAAAPRLRRGLTILGGLGLGAAVLLGGIGLYLELRDGPVVAALDAGDPAALRRALDAGGSARADVGIDSTCPVLFKAIESGDAACAELLLQRGADPNAPGYGETPLAAAAGKPRLVRLLKRYGAR